MKKINAYITVTDKEYNFLLNKLKKGYILCRKIKLYGAGHPQLPKIFFIKGTEDERELFWQKHETTHAKFKQYESIDDIANDKSFWRADIVSKMEEIDDFSIPAYYLNEE